MSKPIEFISTIAVLCSMIGAFASCNKKTDSEAQAQVQAAEPDPAPATARQLAGETAPNRQAPASVPGLEETKVIAPLRDAYDRIDPLKDGWETEAFNSSAMEQLHDLEKLLEGSEIEPDALNQIAADHVTTTELRPTSLIPTFSGNRLKVLRALPQEKAIPGGKKALAAQLVRLQSLGDKITPHLKIFRVARQDETTVTSSVLVDIAGESSDSRSQINATWSCTWSTAADSPPTLTAIQLSKFEEIVQEDQSSTLFADATESILGKNPSYHKQLLTQTDHWRARIPRDFGLDAVANHGLAIGDINGDELDDLYICQQGGLPNRLFVQQADGSLRDITEQSGTGWLDYCASALFVDLDNDGDRDLLVSQDFRILGMENDGNGKFVLSFGASTKAQSFSLTAADYDNNGLVDFYICGYNPSAASIRAGAMGEPMPFHDANNGGPNMLWHNDGNWEFSDLTNVSGLGANNSRFSFAAAWEDYDNDGDQDLYVANDYGRNNLYRNDNGKFTDIAPDLGVEDTSSGMSVSWSDFNHDGHMDLYTSNMFSSAGNRITYQKQFKQDVPQEIREQFQHIALGNTLFQAIPGAPFKDIGASASVQMARWAWGSRFVDFNNDGLDDILVANGFISTADSGDL